jgi:surface carbohydrate biosynthesis protein
MNHQKATLLIPVELQVRELDAKLLLACVAARRGFPSIIGPRREMHFHIPSFPRSIYLSKSVTKASRSVFRTLRQLGHEVVAWDEEALVHLPPENYYQRRIFPDTLNYVSCMLAWGEENAELWRQYPRMPEGLKIYITGNPRGDLMRAEMRSLYQADVKALQNTYGKFILINTNFNQVNAFYPDMNLLKPPESSGQAPELSRRALGLQMTYEYAEGLTRHKKAIFEDFQQLIPALEEAFPTHRIVVRPHPVENQEVYRKIAANCSRVEVINRGNVVPWLIAAEVLVHNGCTTGVESFALGTPAVSYRKSIDEYYDDAYHRFPNMVSHECFDFEELRAALDKIFSGEIGTTNGDQRRTVMDYHLSALTGPLACERMVDVFDELVNSQIDPPRPSARQKLKSRWWASRRRIKKRFRGHLTDMSHNRDEFLKHRYPEITPEELRGKIALFQKAIGNRTELKVEKIYQQFYRISAG